MHRFAPQYFVLILILSIGVIYSLKARKLTPAGSVTGVICGFLIFAGSGFTGLAMMTCFFILGTAATSWGRAKKTITVPAERNGRTAGQVLANSGVATICAVCSILFKNYESLFSLIIAGSFAAAAADTLSSELGIVYGKRFVNILTFKKDEKGLDGVISLEGTVFGIIGAALIATVYLFHDRNLSTFFFLTIAGTVGTLVDSLLGAAFERKGLIKNDGVNFFNTLSGALTALILYALQ
ncbi:DUF92 domain-containing protein [Pedobacter sp. HMF7647]|uniref:DUF92 domain-containing protein n=1 Tax=Hufsiella arboris TaxID=2695275 RepID=A0A7K1Y7K4_9SPHI|nr:DUF92 domain-containing protein [Hufsiella arboris]MXV50553.1 DUF92 domain-containing protein [Hufsiella arboris]